MFKNIMEFKMKKHLLVVLLFLLTFSLLFAEGAKEELKSYQNIEEEVALFPVTLTDMVGRSVTIEKEPERIVSGYYISSSALIAIDADSRIVGIESKSKERPIYKKAAPSLIGLPDVGSAKSFSLETCLETNPDLVILPIKQKNTADVLQDMGIATLVVNPESHEEILYMFSLLGEATGNKEEANELISYYKEKLESIDNLTKNASSRPVVYIGGTSSYLTTAPKDMYQASLIRSAGGVNAADSIEGSSWKEISYEELIKMDPDYIIIPTNNFASSTPGYTREDILNDKTLSEVKAVKNGNVYEMPTGYEAFDSPVPSGILGVLWMTATIHPELYSMDEFKTDMRAFYEKFYGFTPSI